MKTHLNDTVSKNLRFTLKNNGVGFTGLASNCRATFVVCNGQFASYNTACELAIQV